MQKLLFILFFLPLAAFAQQRELVADSSWILNRAGIFYQARFQAYSNGEEASTLTPLGDTATTISRFADYFRSETARFATDANAVSQHRITVTELIRLGKALPEVLGTSPFDSLRKSEPTLLNPSGWTVRSGGNSTAIRFRVTAAGAFQWKADTTAQWRAGAFLGSVIRLNLWNGYTTDFFKSGKAWKTVNGQYSIRSADVGNRDFVDTDDEPPAEVPEKPEAELLPGGVVRIGEKEFKYVTKTKTWVPQ